ncbi:MAG: hypothetical protein MJK12_21530 [Colwellia sp.]|nr:hypothetical protein [Colwellia sp.]
MFKVMIRYLILSLGVIISGCSLFATGENVAIVTGEVNGKCVLTFEPLGLIESKHYYSREIQGVFSADFTISPRDAKYNLYVTCSGAVVHSEVVQIPEESDKLQLGKLVI